MTRTFVVETVDCGDDLEWCGSLEEAKHVIDKLEEYDKGCGKFTPHHYKIAEYDLVNLWHYSDSRLTEELE